MLEKISSSKVGEIFVIEIRFSLCQVLLKVKKLMKAVVILNVKGRRLLYIALQARVV